MKLTEKDKQVACEYIIDEICKDSYGSDYKEKGFHFDFRRTPITIREVVDLFIQWLKIKIINEKQDLSKS